MVSDHDHRVSDHNGRVSDHEGPLSDHQNPVDRAIDLFVYAPLGLALDARTLLPQLIDRGHDQLANQVALARMMGQFAVQQGQSEAGRQLAKLGEQATAALSDLGLLPRSPEPTAPVTSEAEPATAPTTSSVAATAKSVGSTTKSAGPTAKSAGPTAKAAAGGRLERTRRAAPPPAPTQAAADADALAIPGYDSLAASHVIPRLEGLTAAELEAVRSYEAANRGRKTILNKIAQLQG